MGVKHQAKRGTNNEIKMRFCSKDKVNVETAVFGAAVPYYFSFWLKQRPLFVFQRDDYQQNGRF